MISIVVPNPAARARSSRSSPQKESNGQTSQPLLSTVSSPPCSVSLSLSLSRSTLTLSGSSRRPLCRSTPSPSPPRSPTTSSSSRRPASSTRVGSTTCSRSCPSQARPTGAFTPSPEQRDRPPVLTTSAGLFDRKGLDRAGRRASPPLLLARLTSLGHQERLADLLHSLQDELTLAEDEEVIILKREGEWWVGRNAAGQTGSIVRPSSCNSSRSRPCH